MYIYTYMYMYVYIYISIHTFNVIKMIDIDATWCYYKKLMILPAERGTSPTKAMINHHLQWELPQQIDRANKWCVHFFNQQRDNVIALIILVFGQHAVCSSSRIVLKGPRIWDRAAPFPLVKRCLPKHCRIHFWEQLSTSSDHDQRLIPGLSRGWTIKWLNWAQWFDNWQQKYLGIRVVCWNP